MVTYVKCKYCELFNLSSTLDALMRICKEGRPRLSDDQLTDIVEDFKSRKLALKKQLHIKSSKTLYFNFFPNCPLSQTEIPKVKGGGLS